ncbi:cyclin-B2-3-like isoform X2 [Punica granatum]|uniref:Cyclin-B2-3-like isoform X2 n=1 Tax=Punica granatum TaxID=22663 RepID=A0A6P8C9X4_PUNGR|nr:cyclin-B2-3-like isoform X2 [Punica granatum]
MMQNRRALSNINVNVVGARLPCSVAVGERGSSDKNALYDKQPFHPVQRPCPRKFPVSIAGDHQQLLLPEETKKTGHVLPDLNEPDRTVIDLEDYKMMAGDFSAPVFVQHTEAILVEIDEMDEIEMEDAYEEPIMDIDICDKKDPLAVTEYIDDLYRYYKKVEGSGCVPPNYMDQQFDINEHMRAILIDWLIEVQYKFQLMDETLYLTVNLIDRFLSLYPIVRKKLQLVGVTAMLLACKYEEVSVPIVEDLILISDRAYNRKEVLDMERLMVNTLQFNMSVPTPYVFMRRFLKAAQSDKKLLLRSIQLNALLVGLNFGASPVNITPATRKSYFWNARKGWLLSIRVLDRESSRGFTGNTACPSSVMLLKLSLRAFC